VASHLAAFPGSVIITCQHQPAEQILSLALIQVTLPLAFFLLPICSLLKLQMHFQRAKLLVEYRLLLLLQVHLVMV
jgi:hypothetical protein